MLERATKRAEQVAPSKKRGVAARMRKELVAAGVPPQRVHSMVKGLVDESTFEPAVDWNKLGELKHFFIGTGTNSQEIVLIPTQ